MSYTIKHGEYNYWTLYYVSTENLAMCLRSTSEENDMNQTILRRMLNDLVKHDIIKDELPLLRKNDKSYWDGWEISLAFNLCPCIEIYRRADYRSMDAWGWKRITP